MRAPGVAETEPEESLESEPAEDEPLSHEPESSDEDESPPELDDVSYGSVSVLWVVLCVDVEPDAVDPMVAFFTLASAGSSPS